MRVLSFDPAVKNLGYANIEIDANQIKNLDFDLIDLCPKQKVKACTFDFLINSLFTELEKINIDWVDIVLIENQPSMLNALSKSLSIAIYSFFKIKGLNVKLISPCRKLGIAGKKLSYVQKKKESVRQVSELLSVDDKKKLLEKSKQADISDAILQAMAYYKSLPSNKVT